MKKQHEHLPVRNLAMARMHRDVQHVNALLKKHSPQTDDLLEVIDQLDTLETRLHNLAYGDCQFPLRLVAPSVTREPLVIFPGNGHQTPDAA